VELGTAFIRPDRRSSHGEIPQHPVPRNIAANAQTRAAATPNDRLFFEGERIFPEFRAK
jgi:hypothetical protein